MIILKKNSFIRLICVFLCAIFIFSLSGCEVIGGLLADNCPHIWAYGEIVKDLVIGIGLNLNQEKFYGDISEIATSIKNEFGISVDRNVVVSEICNMLEDSVEVLKECICERSI